MMIERVLRILILTLSGVAVGGSIYLSILHIADIRRGIRKAWPFLCARLGFAIVVGLVAEAVGRVALIPSEWRSWLYVVGLTLAGIGYVALAWQSHKLRKPLRHFERKGGVS